MKIAMIGSGAAGSVFASYLRRGGADITLVDPYQEHMDKVAKDGMTFTIYPDQTYHLTGFKTAYNADDIGIMDIVIFMTKTTTLRSAVESAKPCIGPNTVLVSLLNGLGNEDKLLEVVPGDRVIFGYGSQGTFLEGPGKCKASPGARAIQLNMGPVEHSALTDAAGEYLEKTFNAGGLAGKYWDDVRPKLWVKIVSNCCFNALSALLRLRLKYILNDPHGLTLTENVVAECCAVATASGCPLDKDVLMADILAGKDKGIADYYASMAQDVLMHRRQTEIDSLNGAVVEYGRRYGVPTPYNEVITEMICAIQNNYAVQYDTEQQA